MNVCVRCLLGLGASVLLGPASMAQTTNRWVGPPTGGDWTNGDNWSEFFQADADFDNEAVIGSETGNPAVADTIELEITTDLSAIPAPSLTLGDGGAFSGTLRIGSGGRLVTQTGIVATSADINVGQNGGVGVLSVSGTGRLDSGGQLQHTVTSGDGSLIELSGDATVNAASATFRRNLRVVGPGVSFATTGNTTLDAAGVHTWEFGASGPSALSVGGELALGGALGIVTTGATPSVGDSFVIGDSASVSGAFARVDTSGVAGIGLGLSFRAETAAGGNNGFLTSVVVEQQPVLIVNRQTGAVRLANPGAAGTVDFDVYVVGSDAGSLDQSQWTSLAPSSGWEEANPTANALSELNPLGTDSIAGQTAVPLGSVYQPAAPSLGEDVQDVSFQFAPAGDTLIDGVVVYEGVATDNLTLNVDRTTGQAQIINGFREAISIDTYAIESASGALDTTPGGWQALGGDWDVALSGSDAVSELNPLGALVIDNGDAVSLGGLFDTNAAGAAEDFVFRYTLPTEDFFRFGRVEFADELSELLSGDYNLDGVVDAADYTAWRNGLSPYDGREGYDLWAANFGATLPVNAAAVPEPTALVAAGSLAVLLLTAPRRRP